MFNGRPWTPDDTKALLEQVSSKKKMDEIARLQKRTVASVESKLKTIAANLYFNEQLPYEEVEERTGIKKNALVVRRITGSASGSPKIEVPVAMAMAMPEPEPEPQPEPQPIPKREHIQVITTDCPFSLERISTLLISSVTCLLTTS